MRALPTEAELEALRLYELRLHNLLPRTAATELYAHAAKAYCQPEQRVARLDKGVQTVYHRTRQYTQLAPAAPLAVRIKSSGPLKQAN